MGDNMEKHERHYNRMHKKYVRLKPKILPCTCGGTVGMNELHHRIWKKFFIECEECHWASKSYPTMEMAISAWNRNVR